MSGVDLKDWPGVQPISSAEPVFPVVDLKEGLVVCAPGHHLDLNRISSELREQMKELGIPTGGTVTPEQAQILLSTPPMLRMGNCVDAALQLSPETVRNLRDKYLKTVKP